MNVLDPEKIRKIERLLRHQPRGMTISALSARLDMNRNLVAKYLDVLHYAGHVEMQVTGTAKVYFNSHRVPISAMLEFSSDYILVLDTELKILQTNERILDLLHAGRDDLIGRRIDEIDHPFLQGVSRQIFSSGQENNKEKPVEISLVIDNLPTFFSMKQVPTVFEDGCSGLTLILEDITERRKTEEKIRTSMLYRDFFSRKLEEFTELPPNADIYAAIGAGLDALIPDAIIDVNAYDPITKTLNKKAIFGYRAEEFVARTRDNNCNWDLSPAYGTVPDILGTGKLFRLPGKLHYASFEQIPQESSEEIEREFDLGDFYSIGLVWRGNLLGNILFILHSGGTIANDAFIEIYARAASIALQRQIAEAAYNESKGKQTSELLPDCRKISLVT
jgi:PAS domain S-box-containing protein